MKTMVETIPFGIADELGDDETLVLYLDEALASGDPAYFAHALGKVAKVRGMTKVAREAGLSRGSLYAALSEDGNPTLATLMEVMKTLGLRLSAAPMKRAA
ncbi:addiction module antidote protein [Sphingomonas sp. SUN039]|uniref:addiction module antidote protein n=1 Tax=Sphingomonas sp. SUN039 TaxID=2937787 RepID=UPI0021642783|nr:addiction module antidote protein [Sphingomonas sp. SUN039]UVO55498.1 putative addiction module antidote protein [Sphingomonas sp. SUN039]